jgi:hypothetical protein
VAEVKWQSAHTLVAYAMKWNTQKAFAPFPKLLAGMALVKTRIRKTDAGEMVANMANFAMAHSTIVLTACNKITPH